MVVLQLLIFLISQLLVVSLGLFSVKRIIGKSWPSSFSSGFSLSLAYSLGIALFTAFGIGIAYLGQRWLLFPGIVGLIGLTWHQRNDLLSIFQATKNELFKLPRGLIGLVVLGIFIQLTAIVNSGWITDKGATFYRLNSEDGILHVAFAQSMKTTFPPLQPGAADLTITNYHYWSDFYISELSRGFGIDELHLYFHFLPFFLSLGIVVSLVALVRGLGGKNQQVFWTLVCYFFAGNATYIFTLLIQNDWRWHTPAIDHGILLFFNMPQVFARLLFTSALAALAQFASKKDLRWLTVAAVLWGFSTGFKVYFGMFAALGMSCLVLYETITILLAKQKNWQYYRQLLGVYALQGVMSLVVFFPTNTGAGGLFYAPLAWPKILMGQTNIEWNEWWLRMQVYEAAGNTRNVIVMNGVLVGIFLISVFGTRLLGILPTREWFTHEAKKHFLIFAGLPTLLFMFMGMNFLQASGGANIFNFFIIALLCMTIVTGFHWGWLASQRTWLARLLLAILVLLSLPRPLNDGRLFLLSLVKGAEAFTISPAELEALRYLRDHSESDAIVQSHPFNTHDVQKAPYVAYFSQRHSYLAAEGILQSHNQPVAGRLEAVKDTFTVQKITVSEAIQNLKDWNVDYMYLRRGTDLTPLTDASASAYFQPFFENQEITILKRNP
jgi:hypothetical protein